MKKAPLKNFQKYDSQDRIIGDRYSYIIEYKDGDSIEVEMTDVSYGYEMVFDKLLEQYGDDARPINRIEIKLLD